jgi:oligoendopeptidase F
VLNGGKAERDDYFAFLKSGGSQYPIDALNAAGVNMQTPQPIQCALQRFSDIVSSLQALF